MRKPDDCWSFIPMAELAAKAYLVRGNERIPWPDRNKDHHVPGINI